MVFQLGGSMGAAGARHTNTQRNRSLSIIDETTTAAPQPQKHNGIPGVVRAEQRHRVYLVGRADDEELRVAGTRRKQTAAGGRCGPRVRGLPGI